MNEPDLVERAGELASIEDTLRRAHSGAGQFMLVEGPAGVGKSGLLAAAAARARQLEAQVLSAHAGEFEEGLPFEITRQLFVRVLVREPERRERALVHAAVPAARVLGLAGSDSGVTAPSEAQHALYWLAANLAADTPLVLLIDDLQWADPSSQEWLLYLARRLYDLPLAVLATWRTDDPETPSTVLDRLRDEPSTRRLAPQPLSAPGVATVVQATLGAAVDPAACEAVHRLTAGNPFLVAELLRELPGSEPPSVSEIERARPDSVARGVNRRMSRLSEAARALGDAVAILGDGCELRHGAALAGLDEREAIPAADDLAGASILAPERPLRFEHPLVRAALHDAQPLQARDRAHLDAARLLAAEGEPAERIASHLLSAPELADPWTAEQLEIAGQRALRRGAPAEAVQLLARALAEPPLALRRAELLLALGRAEHYTRRGHARAHLEEAVAMATDSIVRSEAAWTLAASFGADGDLAGYERVLLDAAARAKDDDREQHLRLLALLAAGRSLGHIGSNEAREAISREAERVAGTTHGERLLLGVIAFEHLTKDTTPHKAIALAEEALGDGQLFHGGEIDAAPIGQALMVLLVCDRLATAREAINSGLERATQIGSLMAKYIFCSLRCSAGWLAGDLEDSETYGRLALALARDMPGLVSMVTSYLARTLVDRGLTDEADELLQQGPGQHATNLYWSVLAHLRDAQGRHAEAAEAALKLEHVVTAQHGMSCAIPWRLQAAISLAAVGEQPRAAVLLTEQRPITEHWGLSRPIAALQRAEGLVHNNTNHLTHAVATLETTHAPLEHARTLIDLGAMRRRDNQRSQARTALRTGLDLAHRCGADLLVTRATEELAACGARPRQILLTGIDSLTASERRVARLAAQGKSNPEIAQHLYVSRKTIESHLGAIYRKLDISSREEIAHSMEASSSH
jgi:DNA-binding CsgD family transcriptional regulator